MSNRVKEGYFLGVLTIFHVIVTVSLLGKMPVVIFYHFRLTGAIAFALWMLYAALLYLITSVCERGIKISSRDIFMAAGFGFLLAAGKGIMDTVVDRVGCFVTNDSRRIAIETQIEVLLFGIILFTILQLKVAKKKIVFRPDKIMVPALLIGAVLIVYGILVSRSFINYATYANTHTLTEIELDRLNIYFAVKILNHNIWSYAVLYMLFWWCLQKLTEPGEQQGHIYKEKLLKADYAAIILTISYGIYNLLHTYFVPKAVFIANDFLYGAAGRILAWFLYGAGMYLTVRCGLGEEKTDSKLVLKGVCFGGGIGLGKELLDIVLMRLLADRVSHCAATILHELITLAVGAAGILILFWKVEKRKLSFSLTKAQWPITVMLTTAVLYVLWCVGCISEAKTSSSDVMIFPGGGYSFEGYRAATLIEYINIPLYVLFYILVWWLMRSITDRKQEE